MTSQNSHWFLVSPLSCNVPETIDGSFYEGAVYVGYKEAVLQLSSALRRATKLHSMLFPEVGNKSILFVYTDEGPDHHLTFFSVQLTLIAVANHQMSFLR